MKSYLYCYSYKRKYMTSAWLETSYISLNKLMVRFVYAKIVCFHVYYHSLYLCVKVLIHPVYGIIYYYFLKETNAIVCNKDDLLNE